MKLGERQLTKILIINDVNTIINIDLRRIYYNERINFTGSTLLGNLRIINLTWSIRELR